jgi:3-oxoacyl-[acyl-carrier protein] reductase
MNNPKYALIVTGANGNLASQFIIKALQMNYKLILIYHQNRDRIDEFLPEHKNDIRLIATDFSKSEQLEQKFEEVFSSTGWIPRGLFHAATARSSDFQPLADSPTEMWEYIIDVNIKGTFRLLKALIPHFRKYRYGKIVLIGSNVSRIGLPRGSAYAVSKAALGNLSRSIATEEGQNNIYINTISPGPIKIDDSHFSESYRKFREEYYQEKMREIPLQRCASVEDIFGLAWFLLSENNSYITGEEFYITGGKL